MTHRVRYTVRRKCPEKWRTNSWFFIHDNAPARRSVLVKDFIAKFLPVPQLKSVLKGRHFVILLTLRMWWKSWNGFHKVTSTNVFNTFGSRWQKCLFTQWGYFVGNVVWMIVLFRISQK